MFAFHLIVLYSCSMRKKVAVFGLPFSPNCGDQAIAAVLKKNLEDECEVVLCDILARRHCGSKTSLCSRFILTVIVGFIPSCVRNICIPLISSLRFSVLKKRFYVQTISSCDFVLIGGGQLFRDNDGYMAAAVESLYRVLVAVGRPYAVVGCGASPNWSRRTACIFRRLFENPLNKGVFLRDAASERVLRKYGIAVPCKVYADCVFAGEGMGVLLPVHNALYDVGIVLASPQTVAYYGDVHLLRTLHAAKNYIAATVMNWVAGARSILLFSTGTPEDQRYSCCLVSKLRSACPHTVFSVAPRPHTTSELQSLIAKCRKICSFRMHAAILSSINHIPWEVEAWDSKMDGIQCAKEDALRSAAHAMVDEVKQLIAVY